MKFLRDGCSRILQIETVVRKFLQENLWNTLKNASAQLQELKTAPSKVEIRHQLAFPNKHEILSVLGMVCCCRTIINNNISDFIGMEEFLFNTCKLDQLAPLHDNPTQNITQACHKIQTEWKLTTFSIPRFLETDVSTIHGSMEQKFLCNAPLGKVIILFTTEIYRIKIASSSICIWGGLAKLDTTGRHKLFWEIYLKCIIAVCIHVPERL